MARIHALLKEYGESHQNSTNKLIHWVCVPAILVSLLGMVWSIPVPAIFQEIQFGPFHLNWSWLVIFGSLIYYFSLSIKLAIGMMFFTAWLLLIGYVFATFVPLPLWATCLIVFTIAWVGQFWGHKIEGKKPSFMKDIQFLLIGPAWLLSFIFKKFGIPYS
ncbi:MAG TPA: DUF962 domain-containing protein [Bacteroidia bacterium]|nr:DUF962 domain-containing protein [Bacteroidia bacterium]